MLQLTGTAQSFNLSADGNMALTIPADAQGIVISVTGLGIAGSTTLFDELNFANDASKEFTLIIGQTYAASTVLQVENYILTSSSADWPGTGAQTLYFAAPNGYTEGFNVVVYYVTNLDVDNPIVGTDSQQGDTVTSPWDSTIAGATAQDMHFISVYNYNATPTVNDTGQTEVVAPSLFNSAGIGVAYEQGSTSMRATFTSDLVPTAFALRYKAKVPTTIARWPLNEATSGTAPATALDDTGNGNALVINYGASEAEYVTSDTGEGVDFTSPADDSGSARLSRACTQGNLASELSGVSKMSIVMRLDCHETSSFGARAFHIGSAGTNGDVSCFQIATTFNVMWANDSGSGGVTKFPSLVGRNVSTLLIDIDSTQAAANDRIKIWYDGVQQTPTEASTVVQNSTIDPTTGTKYYTIGNRHDQTKPWLGTIYYVSVHKELLGDTYAKAIHTYLSEDNNRDWLTPVAITYAGYNDVSGDVILEGTCNLDHTEITVEIDASGNTDLYRFKSLSDAYKVLSNPFDIDPKVIRQHNALSIANESYVAYPQLYRLSNGNVLCTYSVGATHADNTQRSRGMISTDGDTWDAVNNEFTIYDHPSNFATQGPGGGIDPSDNRPYFFYWYYNPATGGRDERHIVRGDADGTNFAYLKDVNATLDWSDTNLVDGKPFYHYFGPFVPIGGEVFQLAYGRTRAWVTKWDQVAKDLVNKQQIYNNNATHAGGNEANAVDNMGELTMVNIDDTFPARVVFFIRDQKNLDSFAACRGTLDSSGNFTLDTTYGQPEDNIEAWTTETINAGCTIRATRMGDHVLTTWGARLDAETIETTLIDKEMCWNDPLLAVRQNAENNRHTIYNMNPNAVGQGLDTGMPWPLLTTDGNAALIAFYDQQLVGNDDEASVYIATAARLTPDGV